jgi:hypothetical protein
MKTTIKTIEGSRQELFIDGRFVAPKSGAYLPSYDPTTGSGLVRICRGRCGRCRRRRALGRSRAA